HGALATPPHGTSGPLGPAGTAAGPLASTGTGPVPAVAALVDDGKSLAERLLDSERKEIIAAVDKSRGNIASAARPLGINRSTLYYRLRKHGLEHLLPTKVGVGGSDDPTGPGGAHGGEPSPA